MALFGLKKYQRLAKGFQGRAKNCPKIMMNKVQKALQYSYRSRHMRPRQMRENWIRSINSAVREHGINYSSFIHGLNWSNIYLNRKILQDLAINEPYSFKSVVDEVKIQGKILEKPKPQVSLMAAYEKGLIAETSRIWFKKMEQQPYQMGGLKKEGKLTPEEYKQLTKN